MQLLYTGDNYQQPSTKERSLGGFPSSTAIANNGVDNIFSKFFKQDIAVNELEVKMIVIKNITGNTINNLSVYLDDSDNFTYKLAAVEPALNTTCNKYYFEQIDNKKLLPFQATLNQYTNASPLVLTNLNFQADRYLGLWISRKLKETKKQELSTNEANVCSPEYVEKLKANQTELSDTFELKITYS